MAAPGWHSNDPLRAQLRTQPAQFDWHQLVRLLLVERAADSRPAQLERHIRFRADLSLAFPANEVTAIAESSGEQPIGVSTPNYSVAGYLGPLPEAFTEWLHERRAAGDRAMADFLDLFNHRVGALRYRVKVRVCPALDQQMPQDTPLAERLAAVMGLSEPALTDQLPVAKRALLGLAGLLANRRRSVDTIERALACYVGAPVEIEPLRGAWLDIPETDQTRLGHRHSRLGESTVLGERVWDQSARIDVRIGPMSRARLGELLPNGARHAQLAAMLRFLTDREVDCCVRLVADAKGIAGAVLSPMDATVQLGRTTWLGDARIGRREAAFIVPAYEAERAHAA